jgi:hypothetical protein
MEGLEPRAREGLNKLSFRRLSTAQLVKPELPFNSRRLVIRIFGKLLKKLDPGFRRDDAMRLDQSFPRRHGPMLHCEIPPGNALNLAVELPFRHRHVRRPPRTQ